MKVIAEPYKSPRKNIRGGRGWIIPTDNGDIGSNFVADMLGITHTAMHSRIRRYFLGEWKLKELLVPPQKWTAIERNEKRKHKADCDESDGFNMVPDSDIGKLEHLSDRPRSGRLAKIKIGSWEQARLVVSA